MKLWRYTRNSPFQDLIEDVCEDQRDAFIAFVERGENINNFVAHLVGCVECRVAVEEMFEKTKEAFERLARDLRQQR